MEEEEKEQEESTIEYYDLTVRIHGIGSIYLSGEPDPYCQSSSAAGATCSKELLEWSSVSLTAVGQEGATFSGWGGACSGTAGCELTASEDLEVTVDFLDEAPPLVPTIVTPAKGETVQQPPDSGVVVTFNDSGDSGTRQFLCRLNTSDYRKCASPWTTRHLKAGLNTVRVRARDATGNTSAPATRRFLVVDSPS